MHAHLFIPGDYLTTLRYCADHFITLCKESIIDHEMFSVALSGGTTPKALYELLCQSPYHLEVEWEKIHFFWSDERAVPPNHSDSNYSMVLQSGLEKMGIPKKHLHRMVAETDIENHAREYEKKLVETLQDRSLDLVMLGMGDDGHTASLFPHTQALTTSRLVAANYVPQKNSWRMTLTLACINDAHQSVFYVLGAPKAKMLAHVFSSEPHLPCQFVGTAESPALWIVDEAAASMMSS